MVMSNWDSPVPTHRTAAYSTLPEFFFMARVPNGTTVSHGEKIREEDHAIRRQTTIPS